MSLELTQDGDTTVLTVDTVQNLRDAIEADPRLLYKTHRVVCGDIQFHTINDVDSSGCDRRTYTEGLLMGLRMAQELGTP